MHLGVAFEDVRVERGGRVVLEIPSLRVRGGRTTAILGPNGSGKTALLRVIAGLERPRAGRITVDVEPPGSGERGPGAQRFEPGRHLAYVFQEEVFLRRTVRENLEIGLRLRGVDAASRRQRLARAASLLGIAHLLDRRADRLSGGEGRRVSLARALCLQAPLVLLDEPLEGLDERTYVRLLDDLPPLLEAFDATTLLVTHNRDEALRVAQDLVVLVDGRVRAAGEKRAVATDLRESVVAEVLGYYVVAVDGRRVAIAPEALRAGSGALEFSIVVEQVLDLVARREIVGRVGDVRVRVALAAGGEVPPPGGRLLVHAERWSELSGDP